jgi:cytochrome c biogenesis protein
MTTDNSKELTSAGKSFPKKVLGFLSSLRLTLFILLTLAFVSIIGTVVQQGQSPEFYLMEYGERWVGIIDAFQLGDMYHSVWFTFILVMLVVNIIACTIERFPVKWRSLLRDRETIDTSIISKLKKNTALSSDRDKDSVSDSIEALLEKKKFTVRSKKTESGYSIYAWKGLIGRFGSDFTHISLLIILFGSIVGSYWGFKDFEGIFVGDTVEVEGADFSLRLDEFWIDYYDSGQIKQYNSNIVVIEEGKEVLKKQIWVNEPLFYKGIRFYQSSYGKAWDRVKKADFVLIKDEKPVSDYLTLMWDGDPEEFSDGLYSARMISYVSDFAFDQQTKEVFSRSGDVNNPAIQIEVYEDGEVISTPWLFFNYPAQFNSIPDSDYNIVLAGFTNIMYSGISINKDPGVNIVWVGTCIMGFGFYLAFFVYYRRYWLEITTIDGKTRIRVGAMMNKNLLLFDKEFKKNIADISGAIGAISSEDK